MVNLMVEKATSDLLIGPDWAKNIEICDLLNHDPGQAKDVVKGIKKRIGNKNSKVQLLALTLLETIVKNCGDIVHMQVAEKAIPHEMVKLTRKKLDFHVKEKILILIDTWQEAFGGHRSRHPQFYAAYQELLRAGAVFPQRSESSAPVFTPPQTQPLSSYPQNLRSPESRQESTEASAEPEHPTLSSTEIQNAQGIMDVLAEMLSAIDPANKEAVRQEVIVDLVEQCRTYKQRVVHLVNSTLDESLLGQGLALNDDLEKVLAKHEAIASGTSPVLETSKSESSKGPVYVDAPLVDTGESSRQIDTRSSPITPTPVQAANASATLPGKKDPKFDLLSGDFISVDNSNTLTSPDTLALVPVSAPQPSTPVPSQQNALALIDMFAPDNTTSNSRPAGQGYPLASEFQQQQNLQPQHSIPNANGMATSMVLPQNEHVYSQPPGASWSTQAGQPQPQSQLYGAENGETLPPPPWESQPTEPTQPFTPQYPSSQALPMANQQSPNFQCGFHSFVSQPTGTDQIAGMYSQQMTGHMPQSMQSYQGMYPQPYSAQMMGMAPQGMPHGQMGSMYPAQMYANQMGGYGYGYTQQPDTQYLDQRMYGMSLRDDTSMKNSSNQTSMASYLPPMKQKPKGDDKLFGDLVDFSKLKKTAPS